MSLSGLMDIGLSAGRVYGGKTKLWEHYLFTIDENKLVLQE